MAKKIRVGVVFGGRSGEHDVSLQSASSIMSVLDPDKYAVVPIGIDRDGGWHIGSNAVTMLANQETHSLNRAVSHARLTETITSSPMIQDPPALQYAVPVEITQDIDVLFPVLHGTFGEDGTIQGLFEMMDVAYVGAGVLSSAVGMDKIFMKKLFASVGLPQVAYRHYLRRQWNENPEQIIQEVESDFGYPCFVKPANLGSSVGISKAKNRNELVEAMVLAAKYDRKIIIEEGRDVREFEVAVLGNDRPKASVVGEVIPSNEFYDYEAKYINGESELVIPANLPAAVMDEIRGLAIQAYQAVDCLGLARVDFFVEKVTNQVLLNEINTMPGFTRISMYPKLWEASGLPYAELIDTLIELALESQADKRQNQTNFSIE